MWWSASDLGWIVGHSYICYAPLLHGNTTIIYEGKPVGTPDSGAFFRVLSQHNVASMFTAPTALRAIRKVVSILYYSLVSKLYCYDCSHCYNVYMYDDDEDPEVGSQSEVFSANLSSYLLFF